MLNDKGAARVCKLVTILWDYIGQFDEEVVKF